MRKLKLLLAACALTGASAVCAQTDVTSTYLKNADFSSSTPTTAEKIYGYGHDGSPWGLQDVEEWTVVVIKGDEDGGHPNSGMGGAAIAYGSSTLLQGKGVAAPAEGPAGSSGNCLGFFAVWGLGGYYYQNVSLEAGKYTLTIPIYNQSGTQGNTSYCGFFTDGEGGASYTVAVNPTVGSWANQTVSFTLTEKTAGQIRLGYLSTGSGSAANPMIFIDGVKIEYTDLLEGIKADWSAAVQAAQDVLKNDDYEIVTGEERSALETEVAKTEPSTAEDYKAAITALTDATKAFKTAKSAYEELVKANAALTAALDVELPYADSSKKPTEDLAGTANSAAQATAAAATVYEALRAYYESNAKAEGVDGAVDVTNLLTNYTNPTNVSGWTIKNTTGDCKMRIMNNEPYTDADGTSTHSYFDTNSWGAAFASTFTQEIDLPAGKYILSAKARGNGTTTYQLVAGDSQTGITSIGNQGGIFGRGWNDYTVEFTTEGGAVTIGMNLETGSNGNWLSFGDFRLVRLEMYAQMADDDDYAALGTAIEEAEAKTLGFEDGNYAPYNNVEALQALAAAKAIDPTKENGKDMVNDLTNALTSATWTANSGEVDAIYDGQFANTEANTTSGDINLPGWTKVQGIRLLVKDEATDPGLAYTDGKAAVFSWGGTTLTYGEQAGYTLPMTKNEFYKLTLKVSGWRDGDQPNVFTVGLDGQTQTVNPNTMKIDTSEGNPFETLKFYLKPTKENSILTIYANHHFTIADLSLVKATPIEVTVGSEGYATYVTETAMDFSATDIKAYTAKVEDNKVVLTQIEKVPAKTPVVLYYEGGKTEEIPFASETNTPAESDLVAGNGGTVETEVEGFTNYILNNVSGIGFYKAAGQTVAKEHAYLHVAATSEARLQIVFDGATAISEVKSISKGEAVYNLSGQRVNSPKKGLYIIGGKKAVLK